MSKHLANLRQFIDNVHAQAATVVDPRSGSLAPTYLLVTKNAREILHGLDGSHVPEMATWDAAYFHVFAAGEIAHEAPTREKKFSTFLLTPRISTVAPIIGGYSGAQDISKTKIDALDAPMDGVESPLGLLLVFAEWVQGAQFRSLQSMMASVNLGTAAPNNQQWSGAQYSDAPEVVPDTSPEYAPLGAPDHRPAPEVVPQTPDWSLLEKRDEGPESVAPSPIVTEATTQAPTGKPIAVIPWWKTKAIVVGIVVGLTVIIGLAVGLGVGITMSKKDSNATESGSVDNSQSGGDNANRGAEAEDKGNATDASKVSCPGGLCQSLLSLAIHEDVLFIFGRTTEDNIVMRTLNSTTWDDNFVDLGKTPGTIISQPAVFSWKVHKQKKYPRLDVFTVGSPDNTAYRRHYSDDEGWTPWEAEGSNIGSSITICGPYHYKMDVWAISKSNQTIYHDWWYQFPDASFGKTAINNGNTTEHGKMSGGENGWKVEYNLGDAKSMPAVICRDSNIQADILWYDIDQERVLHSGWDEHNKNWTDHEAFEGSFIGNPTVVSFGSSEWDFFGVQANNELYHLSWKGGSIGYSMLRSLGGNIISTPTVISLGDDLLDVIALGEDGNLQHQHYNGSNWLDEWENLEIATHTAPTATVYNKKIYITAVKDDGHLIALWRDVDSNHSWKGTLNQADLGGNLSLDGFEYNS
ncbi:hypothetical protein HJFPF1_09620 [Paramyrothecium foliicola]|nr:hypothetical protein HJFPF1_09620 [Paramyrothecium foliicola]